MEKVRGQVVYELIDRLARKSKPASNECVEWCGHSRNGYGRLTIGSRSDGSRRTVSAHRLSYEISKGEIPNGMYVCHSCDNPLCINPDHLWLGTHQDNVDDREGKLRNNHVRKLSDGDVYKIHSLKGVKTSKELASEFGVSYHTIKHVWCGRLYPKLKPIPPNEVDCEK